MNVEYRAPAVGRIRTPSLLSSRASLLRSLARDAALTRCVQLVR